jgi:two-component system, NarL family, nitrate/nitrite sensor histidine kinase NarX
MMPDRIQGRLGLLFLAFFVLVIVAVGVTFWSLESQKQDALTINLAGRQRMLAQQMAREALEISLGEREIHARALHDSIRMFDQTLQALRYGGAVPYLPGRSEAVSAAREPDVQAQLASIAQTWEGFQNDLKTILEVESGTDAFQAAIQGIRVGAPVLVERSDLAVRLYEDAASRKLNQLRWIQGGFLVSALVLLLIGGWQVRRSIIDPVQVLQGVAERIGRGNLAQPVTLEGPAEVRALADNLERMRSQLQQSRVELLAWTDNLEQRVGQRTRELEALHSVSREITARLDIQAVLRSITHKTQELLGAEVVFLCLLDEHGQTMHLEATNDADSAILRRSASINNPTIDKVLTGENALRCDEQGCHCSCQILAPTYHASHLAAPLKIGNKVIGALCVGSTQSDSLPDDALALLTRLANVAAVALENARLYEQAERGAALEERQRIAAEMHDGLAQTLSYLKLAVDQAAMKVESEKGEEAIGILEHVHHSLDLAVEDTRRAIASLQEEGPVYTSLQDSLAKTAGEFSTASCPVNWDNGVAQPVMLDLQKREHVLRVVREALLNAEKHSGATRIELCLAQVNGGMQISITDDGVGFDLEHTTGENDQQHFGLSIMQARAARIGGQLDVDSRPGAGTIVRLSWQAKEGGH